ncbi:MAG: ABC transporter substrate-binding protein, partial [Methanophagales archaeon]|nr:ABC transporter substrate-binding protein [Methanophagales archaeon]
IQIKLIIVGKEKELTVVERSIHREPFYERAKTFKLPITRIIALDDGNGEPIRVLGTEDLVVGVGTSLVTHDILLPEMSKLPIVASGSDVDYEKVLSLKPDFLLAFASWPLKGLEETLEPHGIQVLRLDCMLPTTEIPEDVIKLGYLLGKVDKAEEFAEFHDDIIDMIRTRTEGLSEDEMPRVYFEHRKYQTTSKTWKHGIICNIAGGNNLANDLPSGGIGYSVDPEWVIERNPDILIRTEWGQSGECGYGVDDTTKIKAIRDEIMNRPELANVNAVKNGNVYIISVELLDGPQIIVAAQYYAKWFHPELFKDWDPQAFHQEYLDSFHKDLNFNVYENGVFVYPEPG